MEFYVHSVCIIRKCTFGEFIDFRISFGPYTLFFYQMPNKRKSETQEDGKTQIVRKCLFKSQFLQYKSH